MGQATVALPQPPLTATLGLDLQTIEAGVSLATMANFVEASGLRFVDIYEVVLPSRTLKRNPDETQKLGDAWLRSGSCALTKVPSAVLPHTFHYLLNPEHPGAALFRVAEVISAQFNPRLLRTKESH